MNENENIDDLNELTSSILKDLEEESHRLDEIGLAAYIEKINSESETEEEKNSIALLCDDVTVAPDSELPSTELRQVNQLELQTGESTYAYQSVLASIERNLQTKTFEPTKVTLAAAERIRENTRRLRESANSPPRANPQSDEDS